MKANTILYKVPIEKFSRRILVAFYPHAIIPLLFLILPFLNKNFYNPITAIWVTLMLLVIIEMLISSYKWTFRQVASLTSNDKFFEIEIVTKNKTQVYRIEKGSIKTRLEWRSRRIKILKLTLFDNDHKIADFYSGGKQKIEYALEEIAYKINKNKTPATNICLPK